MLQQLWNEHCIKGMLFSKMQARRPRSEMRLPSLPAIIVAQSGKLWLNQLPTDVDALQALPCALHEIMANYPAAYAQQLQPLLNGTVWVNPDSQTSADIHLHLTPQHSRVFLSLLLEEVLLYEIPLELLGIRYIPGTRVFQPEKAQPEKDYLYSWRNTWWISGWFKHLIDAPTYSQLLRIVNTHRTRHGLPKYRLTLYDAEDNTSVEIPTEKPESVELTASL